MFRIIDQAIDSAYGQFINYLNDYQADSQIRRDTNISLVVAFVVAGFISPSNNEPEFQFPDNLPSRPSTEFKGSMPSFDNDFLIKSFDEICVLEKTGHQILVSLIDSFADPMIVNYSPRLFTSEVSRTLVSDGETGDWALFQLSSGMLCHMFSGVNFSAEPETETQDNYLIEYLGSSYLERIKPAAGNLITLGRSI